MGAVRCYANGCGGLPRGSSRALIPQRRFFALQPPDRRTNVPDVRDLLQSSIGATHTIERELGGGGMSRVFVAEEKALGRKVVVKTLPPEMAAAVSIERFRRE